MLLQNFRTLLVPFIVISMMSCKKEPRSTSQLNPRELLMGSYSGMVYYYDHKIISTSTGFTSRVLKDTLYNLKLNIDSITDSSVFIHFPRIDNNAFNVRTSESLQMVDSLLWLSPVGHPYRAHEFDLFYQNDSLLGTIQYNLGLYPQEITFTFWMFKN